MSHGINFLNNTKFQGVVEIVELPDGEDVKIHYVNPQVQTYFGPESMNQKFCRTDLHYSPNVVKNWIQVYQNCHHHSPFFENYIEQGKNSKIFTVVLIL